MNIFTSLCFFKSNLLKWNIVLNANFKNGRIRQQGSKYANIMKISSKTFYNYKAGKDCEK